MTLKLKEVVYYIIMDCGSCLVEQIINIASLKNDPFIERQLK
jgi:hypothetical protein